MHPKLTTERRVHEEEKESELGAVGNSRKGSWRAREAGKVRGERYREWDRRGLVEYSFPQTKTGLPRTPHKEKGAEKGQGSVGGGIKIGFKEASPAIPSCLELPKWPKANTPTSLPSAV